MTKTNTTNKVQLPAGMKRRAKRAYPQLTDAQIVEVRKYYSTGEVTHEGLAEYYKVSSTAIQKALADVKPVKG